jgi:hypothetical protein
MISIVSCSNGTTTRDSTELLADTLHQMVHKNEQNTVAFPTNVQVLIPAEYRKESVGYPKNVPDNEWYEIYKDPQTSKWIVNKTELKVSYGEDLCAPEEVMIINSQHEEALLVFTPFEGILKNPETLLENKPLLPGMPVNFKMKDKNYSLLASATDEEGKTISPEQLSRDSENNIYIPHIKNFKLSFGSDEIKSYTLIEMESTSDTNPKIIWLGDLNADGLPDMILDLSNDNESLHLYLFLSDKNDHENPLKKIGDSRIVFDC